jgi:hypothetical protein
LQQRAQRSQRSGMLTYLCLCPRQHGDARAIKNSRICEATMSGRSGVVAEALKAGSDARAAEIAAAAGEQPDFFPMPCAPDQFGKIAKAREAAITGAGRPKGAQNRSTKALREWLLSRGALPQQSLMQWLLMGPDGLVAWAGAASAADKLACFNAWKDTADKLGRYFMAPMVPQDEDGKTVPFMNFVFAGGAGSRDLAGDGRAPWAYLDHEQNQGVSSDDDDGAKDGGAKE